MVAIKPYREKLPKPPQEITCVRCGVKFLIKTKGKPKYCIECRVIIYDENQVKQKIRLKAKVA